MKQFPTILIIIYFSSFSIIYLCLNSCKKADILDTNSSNNQNTQLPQPAGSSSNNFQLNNVSNLVVLNQSNSTAYSKNVLATDTNGNVISLVIPDAKSYSLNINYVVKCNNKYLYLNGSLSVEYLSGKKESYTNFILDTETGFFYQLLSDFGTLWSRSGFRQTPWVTGNIQYDSGGNIYIWSKSEAFYQEITKFEFVKVSPNTMSVKTSTINLIGESYYFNFYILPNGGIIYMYKFNTLRMVWRYRSTSGVTTEIKDLVHNNSLTINGKKYFDSINTEKCFLVIGSDDKPILFLTGRNSIPNSPSYPVENTVQPFNIEIDVNNQVQLKPIDNTKFNYSYIPNNASSDINIFEPCVLFLDYLHGPFYYKQGTKHIFTNRWGGVGFWWYYDDQTQKIVTSFMPYSVQDFSTFSQLMTNSENYVFLPIRTSFYLINLNDLSWKSNENLNFQIFKTNYQGNDKVQFYGISYLNGKKVLGEIDNNGLIKIIKEFDDNVEVRDLIRIGTF